MSGPFVELVPPTRSKAPENHPKAVLDWQAPAGMGTALQVAWRKFYGDARTKYGITPAQYRDLYLAQHGCCYICRKAKGVNPDDPRGRGSRRLAVDHNHVTGEVRGLLCSGGDKTCNRIIGWLTLDALRRAVAYVEGPPARTVRLARSVMDEVPDPAAEDTMLKMVLELQ